MFSTENNETICRVGRGTLMGDAMRRYWIPVCPAAHLPVPDGDPIRVRVVGEDLVAWRDTAGAVAVFDERCAHRGASLSFARNEECGLRCIWHGWKYRTDGTIDEMPNVESPDRLKSLLRGTAYPACEIGGLVWAYLGPAGEEPEEPAYEWTRVPEEQRLIIPTDLDSNYVQHLEGLADSSHVGILHSDLLTREQGASQHVGAIAGHSAPQLQVESTDFGFQYAAIRKVAAADGEPDRHVRVSVFVAPFTFNIPDATFTGSGNNIHISVPIDDTHSRFYNIFWVRDSSAPANWKERITEIFGLTDTQLDSAGVRAVISRPLKPADRNVFSQDREGMSDKRTFSGIDGLSLEDAAMTVGAGAIYDRTQEHLVPADQAVIRLRRTLLKCAERVRDGQPPVGLVTKTDMSSVQAASAIVHGGYDWHQLVPGHHVDHAANVG